MDPYDPSQDSFPVPGFPGDQEALGGPLGNIQNQVADVLNANGDRPNIYIPGGPAEPVFSVPNIWRLLASLFGRKSR